jgi:hypothetical protein
MYFSNEQPINPPRLDIKETVNVITEVYDKIKDGLHPFAVSAALKDICLYCGWTPYEVRVAGDQMQYGDISSPTHSASRPSIKIENSITGSQSIPIKRGHNS